ncbi:MAG TPA: TRAP transporter substrate-binding protein DctP [Vicinamibacterales bacterium]|jgi:tripartite ATP-independent transporter DctP family solute receptor
MSRRRFLKATAAIGAGMVAGAVGGPVSGFAQQAPAVVTRKPIRIILAGYAPPLNGFSLALKRIGDRIETRFGKDIDVKYIYNILDLGYKGEDLPWLVESGVLTVAYQSSSYFTDQIPDLGIADLPFLFSDGEKARAAMDGRFGATLAQRMEAKGNYRILGWFENGFRHISNRLRPIHTPADMKGMTIRVLPSKVQERTFELLGATPRVMDLSELLPAIKAGTLDAQENPFSNTTTYGVHKFHKFHTASNHFYLSRPVFFNKTQFDAWPKALQDETRASVKDAVEFQRGLHVKEELVAMIEIQKEGGTIVQLTPQEHQTFVDAVKPIYGEARGQYDRELLSLANL